MYVHPWLPLLVLITWCCGGSVRVESRCPLESAVVTGNIIAVGVLMAVS